MFCIFFVCCFFHFCACVHSSTLRYTIYIYFINITASSFVFYAMQCHALPRLYFSLVACGSSPYVLFVCVYLACCWAHFFFILSSTTHTHTHHNNLPFWYLRPIAQKLWVFKSMTDYFSKTCHLDFCTKTIFLLSCFAVQRNDCWLPDVLLFFIVSSLRTLFIFFCCWFLFIFSLLFVVGILLVACFFFVCVLLLEWNSQQMRHNQPASQPAVAMLL